MASTKTAEMAYNTRPSSIFAKPERPISNFTDIMDESEWDDSDEGSIFEEDSPRGSFDTITTVDDAPTPEDSVKDFLIELQRRPSTTGPSGPHLFRASFDSADEGCLRSPLQLSPLLPKHPASLDKIMIESPVDIAHATHTRVPVAETSDSDSDENGVRSWTTQQVVDWMLRTGFESSIVDTFEEHAINGEALLFMQLEDLKELGITAFGQRVSIWNRLAALREDGSSSPAPTVFEEISRPATTATAALENRATRDPSRRRKDECGVDTPLSAYVQKKHKVRRGHRSRFDDALTPAESVSIVAIEQLLPKPHRCSKGTDCPKHKRQERLRKQLEKENAISPVNGGGSIWITGYFDEFGGQAVENGLREGEPSVVASSDLLMGAAAQTPKFNMDKDMQQQIKKYEAQDSVQQYLSLQHIREGAGSVDLPPTPPLETPQFNSMRDVVPTPRFAPPGPVTQPPPPTPKAQLQQLPKLSIPRSNSAGPLTGASARSQRSPRNAITSPVNRVKSPLSAIHRVASPASLNDLPMRSMTLSPIGRDASRTVPPNMHFRPPVARRGSRSPSSWQRASMKQPLQGIPEYGAAAVATAPVMTPISPQRSPIRVSDRIAYGSGTTHAGYMRKRKTKLLKHEWQQQHMRLQGTMLAMHASHRIGDRNPLDTIDIDEFTVACSSVSSDSRLAAALKSLRIMSEKKQAGLNDAAFVFQLIPAGDRGKVVKLLRDVKNGGGRTHHFAVNSKEDRIDWMRQVMLAKAKKSRQEDHEDTCSGHEIA